MGNFRYDLQYGGLDNRLYRKWCTPVGRRVEFPIRFDTAGELMSGSKCVGELLESRNWENGDTGTESVSKVDLKHLKKSKMSNCNR